MTKWLAVAAVAALVATAAHAQMKELAEPYSGKVSHVGAPELRVSGQVWPSSPAPFADGMIADEYVASNAFLGVGLVRMSGRKKAGAELRPGAAAPQIRNPAVTFVLKF